MIRLDAYMATLYHDRMSIARAYRYYVYPTLTGRRRERMR